MGDISCVIFTGFFFQAHDLIYVISAGSFYQCLQYQYRLQLCNLSQAVTVIQLIAYKM